MELVEPSIAYKNSYIEAIKEAQADTDNSLRTQEYRKISIADLEADFESYVEREKSHARGENLPEGWVPCTTLWLVDNGEYIGRASIRHRLTEKLMQFGGHIGYDIRPSMRGKGYGSKILALALPKARELGITRALVMCDSVNTASRKVIEKNGGVLWDTNINPNSGESTQRFWIENQ